MHLFALILRRIVARIGSTLILLSSCAATLSLAISALLVWPISAEARVIPAIVYYQAAILTTGPSNQFATPEAACIGAVAAYTSASYMDSSRFASKLFC